MARNLEIAIVGDSSSFRRELAKSGSAASGFGSKLKTVGKFAALGIGIAGAAAGAAGVKMIGLASDAEEVESKFKVIFGKTVPRLTKQIDAFAAATGASRFELKEQVADLGALLKPIIGNTRETGKMSVAVAKLATDLSSFNNVPVEEALLAIRSGLVGEAEPLRRFGVLLNEAAVQAEAVRMGLVKEGEELTEAQKVQARYNLVMKQTKLAQGDAERTSGSFANQLRRLKNGVRDAGTSLGKFLLPVATSVVGAFNDAIPAMQKFLDKLGKADGFKAKFNVVWTGISEAVGDLIDRIREELFGSRSKPVELESGRFFRFVPGGRSTGLIESIRDSLANADWTEIGQRVGEGISKRIQITADFIGRVLTAARTFIDQHGDEFADLGAKMMLKIISKLLDPAFWLKNWQLIIGIAVAVVPIGRFATIGGRLAKALGGRLVKGLLDIIPTGFGIVVLEATRILGRLLGWLQGPFRALLARIPGWLKAAFRLTFWLSFVSAIQSGWERVKRAVSGAVDFIVDKLKQIWDWLQRLMQPWTIRIRIPTPSIPDPGEGVPFVPGIASGGDIARSGLAVVHRGERVVPARVVNRGVGRSGGEVRVIVVGGDAAAISYLQNLDQRARRGNGGRGIL